MAHRANIFDIIPFDFIDEKIRDGSVECHSTYDSKLRSHDYVLTFPNRLILELRQNSFFAPSCLRCSVAATLSANVEWPPYAVGAQWSVEDCRNTNPSTVLFTDRVELTCAINCLIIIDQRRMHEGTRGSVGFKIPPPPEPQTGRIAGIEQEDIDALMSSFVLPP